LIAEYGFLQQLLEQLSHLRFAARHSQRRVLHVDVLVQLQHLSGSEDSDDRPLYVVATGVRIMFFGRFFTGDSLSDDCVNVSIAPSELRSSLSVVVRLLLLSVPGVYVCCYGGAADDVGELLDRLGVCPFFIEG
jgi:hypothetical protein